MASTRLFTESQWEELEHQALIFNYLVAGLPIPPHLIFLITKPFLSSPSTFFSPHFTNWNMYEMGFGRKIETEPGRCRRTDGKKWRCSKEAYPDSKYCERHMHRGKNRPRKPSPPSPHHISLHSPISNDFRGRRRGRNGYMDDFLSMESCGSIKSCSSSVMEEDDASWGYKSLTLNSRVSSQYKKQRDNNNGCCEGEKQGHCFILGTDVGKCETPLKLGEKKQKLQKEEEEEGKKSFHRFLEEWPSSNSPVSTSLFI